MTDVLSGLLIPFAGTTLGAACVLFVKKEMNVILQRALTGFAAGVMVAASVWSLLLPALSQASSMGRWSFVPAVMGFWAGIMFLFLLDNIVPHLHSDTEQAEGPRANLKKTTMLVLAVTLHNIPEGMAVGAVYAGYISGNSGITLMSAMALAVGIAIQNFPEGAIISMPLRSRGIGRGEIIFVRSVVRCGGACGCCLNHHGSRHCCSGSSVPFKLRSRGDDLRGCRGAYTRDGTGKGKAE